MTAEPPTHAWSANRPGRSDDAPRRPAGPIALSRDLGGWGEQPWAMGGYPTFLGAPLCLTFADVEAADVDIVILGVPWDGTMGAPPGTRHAAAAIRTAEYTGGRGGQWHHGSTRINPLDHLRIADLGDVPVVHGAIEITFDRIRTVVRHLIEAGTIPVMLGGDHAVTWPHVRALGEARPDARIGVIHFDAHCDTWPLESGEYASHGSPMRQLIDGGVVEGRHFVQIGLRSATDPRTIAYMESNGMRSHWMAEIQHKGLDAVLDDALHEASQDTDVIFLSVDVDVCDPAFAPGSGAPEPGGLTSAQLLTAVRRIAHEVGVAAMDVVEVSPPYEAGNSITALLAHRAVTECLTGLAQRTAGLPGPDYSHRRTREGPPQPEQ